MGSRRSIHRGCCRRVGCRFGSCQEHRGRGASSFGGGARGSSHRLGLRARRACLVFYFQGFGFFNLSPFWGARKRGGGGEFDFVSGSFEALVEENGGGVFKFEEG